jgi:hypothetical protein
MKIKISLLYSLILLGSSVVIPVQLFAREKTKSSKNLRPPGFGVCYPLIATNILIRWIG